MLIFEISNSMKKHILTFALILMAGITAFAGDVVTVTFHTTDGKQVGYAMEDHPKATFVASNKYLYLSTDLETVLYQVSKLQKFTFSDDPTAVESVATTTTQTAKAERGTITFAGYAEGTPLYVYTEGGALVQQAKAAADGTAQMTLAGRPAGIYIVKGGSVNFKITVK